MNGRRNVFHATLIICLLAAVLTGRSVFFDVALIITNIYLFALFWAWITLRGIVISRTTPTHRAQVGNVFVEDFALRNTTLFPKSWLEIWDYSTLPNHKANHVVPLILPRMRHQWQIETPCLARGEFRLGHLEFMTSDPFGLFQAKRVLNATESLIVYPKVVPLTQFVMPQGVLSGGDAQRHITQNVTTNATSVRDYVAGDSINRIHWRTTARRDKLTVKEFELDPLVDIWLMLDLSLESLYEAPSVERLDGNGTVLAQSDTLPRSTEEYGVVIAASLASFFYDSSRAFGFVTHTGQRILHLPERSHHQLTQTLETLAIARSNANITTQELLASEMFRFSRGTTLVIVTASDKEDWVNTLQILQQRNIKPMIVHINATSFGKRQAPVNMMEKFLSLRIPAISVQYGDDLSQALARRYN